MLTSVQKWLRHWHWRTLLVPILLLIVGLLVGSTAFSPSYRDCEKQQHEQASENQAGHFQYQVGVVVYCEAIFAEANNGAITAVSTIFVAIFTLTLWLATTYQGKLTERAIEDSKISSERQLRAYVSPTGGKVISDGVGPKFEVAVIVKNSGQTPAYDFNARGAMSAADFPLSDPLKTKFVDTGGKQVLGPGTEFALRWHAAQTFFQTNLPAITNGARAIYADGEYSYRDAFNITRKGKFRLFYGGRTGAPASGEMSFYESGNTAD